LQEGKDVAKGIKTGGRKAGTPNKITVKREAELAASGLMPLDHMLSILRNEKETAGRRDWAAEKAAPYCDPRLSVADVTANISTTHVAWLEQLK
jgi:hypothetical protein